MRDISLVSQRLDFRTPRYEVPTMAKKIKPVKPVTPSKDAWREISDHKHRSFATRPNPESLHPGPATVERAAMTSNPEARAIIDSYAFRFPVTIVEALNAY
jgi:hypothetical protein